MVVSVLSVKTNTHTMSKREEKIRELREKIQKKLISRVSRMVKPDPPPRYDNVFFEGLRLLEEMWIPDNKIK